MTQFSWGVLGIKPETAMKIEDNLKSPDSVFYPGPEFEKLLDFQSKNINQERFLRITNSDDHYYAYLYGALYNKEIISQWQKAGFDISDRPEILATLYNIGFDHSNPSANPKVGGAELNIGDATYSFGRLAYEFYYSGELLDEFPQVTKDNSTTNSSANAAASAETPLDNPADISAAALAPSLSDDLAQLQDLNWSDWMHVLLPLFK
jgi:hypothetical protein